LQPQEAQGRLAQLQAELSRTQSQNKLLASNLQQKDRELSGLRQQKAQLERAAQGSGGGGAPPRPFAVGEMQKQLELAQKQLAFKESEVGGGRLLLCWLLCCLALCPAAELAVLLCPGTLLSWLCCFVLARC
jgi:multidrug efflux pump subunit AcrA (membrane-fusion protein)